ncbi:MAG: RagB/SusD family nutrient uptake outer membrane protein [Candidatus Pseudobacter hemicellulosilyticus]|uniref:RagB/SusD family nutrient uptake outer membrane protein n=1 Tax=Candidatus Pseudobacter hemicellulosilyticus TaxID=3121375 RepID=A0AAJ5WRT0_9BACT|nr:MAG: RagB/SusD family nutrient uptake outer membrane protein [Pseudobacter sp.]
MKRAIILYTTLAILLSFSSCNKFLDQQPDDILTKEMVFNDEQRVQQWLAAIYKYIPDPYWDYGRALGFNPLADEVQIPLTWSSFGWWPANVQQGNWNPSMGTYDFWGNTYKAVRSAYIFLDNVKPLPAQTLSQQQVDMMKLEARFLIAYYYSQMLELYGPFPLVTRLIDADAAIEDLLLPRTPFDQIVDHLDKELLDLANQLPTYLASENTDFGRPTRGIALAVRARMLLVAASPLYNGNPMYQQLKNTDGTALFTASYDANKWKKAADATRLLLDLAETGVYDLYKEYRNGAIDPFLSFQNLFLTPGNSNKEIIFARADCNIGEYDKHSQPRGFGGNGGYGITQELVDAFYTRNGLPIADDPEYSEDGFSTTDGLYTNTSWKLGNQAATEGLVTPKGTFNMYVNREPRFYITVRYNGQWIPKEGRNTQFYNGGWDGLPSYDSPPCGYLVRKRVHPESIPRNSYTPYRPGILFRLGEFYLNYAEALNEYDPQHTDIEKYMNRIRERAGVPNLSSTLKGQQAAMREAIHAERRVELATEGKRYMDMRRWLIAQTVFTKPVTGMNTQAGSGDFFKRTSFMSRAFDSKMYLWPIYQQYIDRNPNLLQNPGW